MPSVAAPAKALVTGANGYLGAWLVRTLIEHGHFVRGTVRTQAKGDLIKHVLGEAADRFDYVIVEDVSKDGAFDDAIKDVAVAMHTLSPVLLSTKPDEVMLPAINGILNLLRSARKHQDTLRRVVVTGSICGVLDWPASEPRVYDEASMNEVSIKASEKEAWAYMQEQDITTFDLVYLKGSLFFGPYLLPISSVNEMTSSLHNLYLAVILGRVENPLFKTGAGWIDVRDMALAHVLAAQKEDAGGQRIIISAGDCVVADLVAMAHSINPSLPEAANGALPDNRYMFNTNKMRHILDLQPRSLEETMCDSLHLFESIPEEEPNLEAAVQRDM
ncbi:NAD-P-binding protein [Peniophora sp. CONT]|nr:NAD-P-binding protein [Peniophora sp. CONT]